MHLSITMYLHLNCILPSTFLKSLKFGNSEGRDQFVTDAFFLDETNIKCLTIYSYVVN